MLYPYQNLPIPHNKSASYTLQSFLSGQVAEVRGKKFAARHSLAKDPEDPDIKRSRVALTWIHTNEPHAPQTAWQIYTKNPDIAPYIDYLCLDPLTAATTPEIGFAGEDPNRSFNPKTLAQPKSPEQYSAALKAAKALDFLARSGADYIIDPHNTVCEGFGIAAIVSQQHWQTPEVQRILAASAVKRILVMDEAVAGDCLIGALPNVVTFEAEMGLNQEAVAHTTALVRALVEGTSLLPEPVERDVFYMDGTILKTEDPGDVPNFELLTMPDGREIYPIMLSSRTNPRSYHNDETKDYVCHSASRREVITL